MQIVVVPIFRFVIRRQQNGIDAHVLLVQRHVIAIFGVIHPCFHVMHVAAIDWLVIVIRIIVIVIVIVL